MEKFRWVRIPAVILAGAMLCIVACSKSPTSAITGASVSQMQFARGGVPGRPGGGDAGTGGGNATQFSGEATAEQANVLGIQTTLGHAGPLAASGGAEEASLLTANIPGTL